MDVENEVSRGTPRPAEPLWGWPRKALAAGNSCVRGNTRRRRRRSRELDRVEGEQQLAPFPAGLIDRKLARLDEPVNGGGGKSRDAAELLEGQQLRRTLLYVRGHELSRPKTEFEFCYLECSYLIFAASERFLMDTDSIADRIGVLAEEL